MADEHGFVIVDGGTDGVGKLIGASAGVAEIEYFVSPAGPQTKTVSIPAKRVRRVELPAQTRIFWLDPKDSAWRIGRVDGGLVSAQALRTAEDHYHVRFPNHFDERIPCSQLYTRWAHPIEDPTDHLAARITESPLFYDGRRQIVQHLAGQRAAFGGLTGLASSAVEFFEHQVTIVRRILSDPIERYLLADEVGLGKTIEAGVLIRQHVLDQPSKAAVLVVVPSHLAAQWQLELERKFFLTTPVPVRILTEQEVLDGFAGDDGEITMLVIDEAHRAATCAFSGNPTERRLYERLRELSLRVSRLLLLSATPVLHHEDGFLAMLHLLDPDAYRLEDRELFSRRVRERQTVAESVVDLSDDASSLFAEEALDRLASAFADDARLTDLADAARSLLSRSIEDCERRRAIGRLRRHLVESYRLHRRLLRTRRDDARVRDLLPHRTLPIVVEYDDPAREEAAEALEAWRRFATEGDTGHTDFNSLFTLLVESALSHPRVLLRRVETRLALQDHRERSRSSRELQLLGLPWAFAAEREFWSERLPLLAESLSSEARAERLVEWLRDNPSVRKAVVFCDDSQSADVVASTVGSSLGAGCVIRHVLDATVEQSFEDNDETRVLVCDAAAEEGLNLQRVGAVVVHYDLPLEPTRIEQRIGRVDRIEAARHVRNVVMTSGVRYEREWLRCLLEAVRVFERSTAALQYVLLEGASRVRAALLDEGASAIEAEAARMLDPQQGLEAELRRIRAQEALDAVEEMPDDAHGFFQGLQDADDRAESEGPEAFDGWLVKRLQFARRQVGDAVQYVHLSGGHKQTLIPTFDTATRFQSLVDRRGDSRRRNGELPLLAFTFSRVAAEKVGIPILRAGNPFVSAVEALMRADDRGAAFAMWRVVRARNLDTPRLFLRFDFVIETDLSFANSFVIDHAGLIESVRRRADASFPVQHQTLWLNADLQQVKHAPLIEALERPYRPAREGGTDLNLRPDRWPAVEAAVSIGDWDGVCQRARARAEESVRSAPEFVELCKRHADHVRAGAAAADDLFRSRISRLSGLPRVAEEATAKFEARLAEAIAAGIDKPTFRVDAAGAVFLSKSRLLVEDAP